MKSRTNSTHALRLLFAAFCAAILLVGIAAPARADKGSGSGSSGSGSSGSGSSGSGSSGSGSSGSGSDDSSKTTSASSTVSTLASGGSSSGSFVTTATLASGSGSSGSGSSGSGSSGSGSSGSDDDDDDDDDDSTTQPTVAASTASTRAPSAPPSSRVTATLAVTTAPRRVDGEGASKRAEAKTACGRAGTLVVEATDVGSGLRVKSRVVAKSKVSWNVTLLHDRTLEWRGSVREGRIDRVVRNLPGSDTITLRVTDNRGSICALSLTVAG